MTVDKKTSVSSSTTDHAHDTQSKIQHSAPVQKNNTVSSKTTDDTDDTRSGLPIWILWIFLGITGLIIILQLFISNGGTIRLTLLETKAVSHSGTVQVIGSSDLDGNGITEIVVCISQQYRDELPDDELPAGYIVVLEYKNGFRQRFSSGALVNSIQGFIYPEQFHNIDLLNSNYQLISGESYDYRLSWNVERERFTLTQIATPPYESPMHATQSKGIMHDEFDDAIPNLESAIIAFETDLNGNGEKELIIAGGWRKGLHEPVYTGIRCYRENIHTDTYTEIGKSEYMDALSALQCADITGDEKPELIAGDRHGQIHIITVR